MDVLFVTGTVPYPPTSGASTRSYHLIRRMAKRHRVHLITYAVLPDDIKCLRVFEDCCATVRSVPWRETKGTPSFYVQALMNVLSRTPLVVSRFTKSSMTRAIESALDEERIDLIHCDFLSLSLNLPKPSKRDIPALLTAHNVESLLWKRYVEHQTNPLKALYLYLHYRKVVSFERSNLSRFKHVVCVSQNDMDRLTMLSPLPKYSVVPNGVDLEYFRPLATSQEPYRLVFTGSMDWRPNQDAVRFFVAGIYPRIKAAEPRASLILVGRNAPESLRAMCESHSDITVTGTVNDVRPYIASAAVYVVPLRIGGGTRLKILEAMAMGKPVVSTSVGCEGLAVVGDRNLLVADQPDRFADMVLRLLKDSALAAEIGQAGHDVVRQAYGWDEIADTLDEAWHDAAFERRGTPCAGSLAC